jgi:hypothetical protein
MPVKRRVVKARDDYPMPWEDRPISRERWERHRDRLLARAHSGDRPPEWWAYESPVPRPCALDGPRECQVLYEIGELSKDEIEALMPEWRRHYERSHEPHFSYCAGQGNWLEGTPARRALYRWAGIPREFIKQWDAERRARTKTFVSWRR